MLQCYCVDAWRDSAQRFTTRIIHVCFSDLLLRKPRINSQLVAQQVAQQYPMPPPPKKDRRERSERPEKERLLVEGEPASGEGRPEVERPERVMLEGDTPEKDKSDNEQAVQDKPDKEKDISPAVTKKPSSKKNRLVPESGSDWCLEVCCAVLNPHLCFLPDLSQTTIRVHPVTNRAYSLGSQQPRPTRTLTIPGV